MNLLMLPDMSAEELERRRRAMREAEAEISRTPESLAAHLLKIAAISKTAAERFLRRERARAGRERGAGPDRAKSARPR